MTFGARDGVRPVGRRQFLTPTLRKERTESGETLDVQRPTLGGSPRKEGGVYHILQAQGQTQFASRERAQDARGTGLALGQGQKLAAAVGRAVGRLDEPGGLAGPHRLGDLLKPRGKLAGTNRISRSSGRISPETMSRFSRWASVRANDIAVPGKRQASRA
jgi:hypothetical protein